MNATTFYPAATISESAVIIVPGLTSLALPSLTVVWAWVEFGADVAVDVAGDVVVDGGGATRLVIGRHGQLAAGGDLRLENGGDLYVYGGESGAAPWSDYGALVQVAGTIDVGSGSWIYPVSDGVNGGSPKFVATDVTVASGGGFDASRDGYDGGVPNHGDGKGPGGGEGGVYSGGGGYGGGGGSGGTGAGGVTYGNADAPTQPGSGGAAYDANRPGGEGGGLIWIEASGTVTLGGALRANGGNGVWFGAGGGSGGGIYVDTGLFTGTGGVLQANGGNGAHPSYGGGGGGGRIAVWRTTDTSSGVTATVAGGVGGQAGGLGTIVWGITPPDCISCVDLKAQVVGGVCTAAAGLTSFKDLAAVIEQEMQAILDAAGLVVCEPGTLADCVAELLTELGVPH